jgi:hypothetical protein
MVTRTFALLLAGLGFAATASAQPQGTPVESVIVTAQKQRPEEALNQFIIVHAAPSPALGKIARWKTGICPLAIGLSPKFNQFITQRLIRVAMLAGAPLDSSEPCRLNILILATSQPQDVLDFVRTKRPALLGFHYRSQSARIAAMHLPIQAWYSTATEDFHGLVAADIPNGDLGYGVMSTTGAPRGVNVSGNRAIGDGLKSELTTAIVLVDAGKIGGKEIGALADYVAMLALSQAQSYEDCQPVPTITNLMASGCAEGTRPDGITDIDATYLRGLYKMDAGRSLLGERSSIAYEMKKELGGY